MRRTITSGNTPVRIATIVLLLGAVAAAQDAAVPPPGAVFRRVGRAVVAPCLVKQFDYTGYPGRMFVESDTEVFLEAGDHLYCYDLKTMTERWRTPGILNSDCVSMGPMAMRMHGIHLDARKDYANAAPPGDILAVMGTDGKVTGVRKATGQKVWAFAPPGAAGAAVRGRPRQTRFPIMDKVVYAVLGDVLYAVGAEDGKEAWHVDLAATVPGKLHLAAPLACGARICTGNLGVDPQRKKAWHLKNPFNAFLGDLVPSGSLVCFSVNHHMNDLYAVDADTGKVRWTFSKAEAETPMGIMPPPAVSGDRLIVAFHNKEGGGTNTLYGLDSKTGKELWNLKLGAVVPRAPEMFDGVGYVYTWDKAVEIIDCDTGRRTGVFKPSLAAGQDAGGRGPFAGQRTGGQDIAYIAALPGVLLAPLMPEGQRSVGGGQMSSATTSHRERGLGLRVYRCGRYGAATARAVLGGDVQKALNDQPALLKYAREEKLAGNPHYVLELLQHVDDRVAAAACRWLREKFGKDFGFLDAKTDADKLKAFKQWEAAVSAANK